MPRLKSRNPRGVRNLASILLLAFATLLIAPAISHAEEIPILTWERGKEQNIVLGGQTQQSHWDIYLVDSSKRISLRFAQSVANSKGFIVYSILIPNDEPLGAYHVTASGKDGTNKVVAGVQLVPRAVYAITQVPTDLCLLLIFYALFTSTFSIIRGRRYSYLAFVRHARFNAKEADSDPESKPKLRSLLAPLYTFRLRRQLGMDMSFLRFVTLRDGEVLHKASPNTWAVLPFIAFLAGTYEAVMMQGHHLVPHMNMVIYAVFTLVGVLDAASGYAAAIAFFTVQILFVDISSLRSVLTDLTFTMPWFAPSMLASIYYMTLKIDFFDYLKKFGSKSKIVLTLVISAIFGGASVVFAVVLLQSLLINQFTSAFMRWPLGLIVFIALVGKNLLNELIDMRVLKGSSTIEMKVESIYVARVLSPTFATLLAIAILGLIYVWTQQLVTSLLVTLLLVFPYILLFVTFPEFAGRRLPNFPRNITIEATLMAVVAGVIFFLIELLPLEVIQKSKTFILLGVVPSVIHALYSVVVDSSERAKRNSLANSAESESTSNSEPGKGGGSNA
jgi:hypothetical protein